MNFRLSERYVGWLKHRVHNGVATAASTPRYINARARRVRHPSSHESKWRMFGLRPSLCKFGAPLKKEGFTIGFFLIWTYLLASFLPYIDLSSFCRLAFNNDLLGKAFVRAPANDVLHRRVFFRFLQQTLFFAVIYRTSINFSLHLKERLIIRLDAWNKFFFLKVVQNWLCLMQQLFYTEC